MKRVPALSVGLSLATVASLALACTSAGGTTAQPGVHGPVGPVPAGLGQFYGQALSWGGCSSFAKTPSDQKAYADPDLQCAYLTVPLDYANPNGRTIKVGLLRHPASDPAQRIGSLVINPGGPGGSGMSTAASLADTIMSNDVGRRFDLVGFDPRGVGASEPQIVCRNATERDRERLMNLNVDTSPDGVAKTESQEKADDEGCVKGTGKDVLANIGTREVVRDMDVMRSALGDEKLTYLGYSYGTRIGTSYAEAFPKNVRAMILDGAVDEAQDPAVQLVDQGRGFQKAFDAFAAWCAVRADCALGPDKSQAVSKFQALVRPLINQPVGVSDGRKLSYTDATIGTVQALYLSDLWPILNRGLGNSSRVTETLLCALPITTMDDPKMVPTPPRWMSSRPSFVSTTRPSKIVMWPAISTLNTGKSPHSSTQDSRPHLPLITAPSGPYHPPADLTTPRPLDCRQ